MLLLRHRITEKKPNKKHDCSIIPEDQEEPSPLKFQSSPNTQQEHKGNCSIKWNKRCLWLLILLHLLSFVIITRLVSIHYLRLHVRAQVEALARYKDNHTNIPGPESRTGQNGQKGYVHDPSFLSKNPRPFHILDKEWTCRQPGEGIELPSGYKALKRIRDHLETSKASRDVKLFCSVYTHDGGIENTNAIQETWGKRCDGILFAGSQTNTTTGHTHLPSNSKHGYRYKGMIQRTRSILAYLYDNFLDKYDYFHINGDDTYLIVENLKEFLASKKVQKWEQTSGNYLFAGFIMHYKKGTKEHFLAGGSGYTLSQKALKAFVEGPLEKCNPHQEGSAEDKFISKCFEQFLNKNWIDTRDLSGAHRYHQCPLAHHATFPDIQYGIGTQLVAMSMQFMYHEYGFPQVYKDEYISESSVAFHRFVRNDDDLRRLELLLYDTGLEQCHKLQAGN